MRLAKHLWHDQAGSPLESPYIFEQGDRLSLHETVPQSREVAESL